MAARDTDIGKQFGNETDKAYDKLKSKHDNSAKAKKVLVGAGYARGGGVSPIKAMKAKKMAKIGGSKPKARADKFARGGSAPSGHHARTKIQINMGASEADKKDAMQKGVQLGATLAARKLQGGMPGGPRPGAGAPMQARPMPPPGGAPMPPPGSGAPPMAGPGGPPPPMAARGGRMFKRGGKVGPKKVAGVTNISTGGGGGAKGRMEKMRKYGTKPKQ